MKKIIYLLSIFILLSCGSDEVDQGLKLIACFNVDKETVQVGELINITNCSENADIYTYDFGNGEESNEESPKIFYKKGGEYTIRLEVKNAEGNPLYTSKEIKVVDTSTNFVELSSSIGDSFIPLTTGFNRDQLFYVETIQNRESSSSRKKVNYVQYDFNSQTIEKKNVSDDVLNSERAFVNFLNTSKTSVFFSSTLTNRNSGVEVVLDADFNVLNSSGWSAVYYGFIPTSDKYLYFGSDFSNGSFKPSIEIRDNNDQFIETKTFESIEQGFIGSLLKTDNGYIAFGGSSKPISLSEFENFKSFIMFLDSDLNIIRQETYDLNLNTEIKNYNDINGIYNLQKLTNGNYVAYSHSYIILIDSEGEQIKKMKVDGSESYNQGLLGIQNGFIITRENYIESYSNDGELIKSIEFKGDFTPKLIEKNGVIYFVSGYLTSEELVQGNVSLFKAFIGGIDADLIPVNLN